MQWKQNSVSWRDIDWLGEIPELFRWMKRRSSLGKPQWKEERKKGWLIYSNFCIWDISTNFGRLEKFTICLSKLIQYIVNGFHFGINTLSNRKWGTFFSLFFKVIFVDQPIIKGFLILMGLVKLILKKLKKKTVSCNLNIKLH